MKIVDVVLKDDSAGAKLVFSDGAERLATETEKQYFERRKKLKAALVKKKGDDGNVVFDEQNNPVMEYKVFRWADYHRHSWYSLLDGCVSIKDMVDRTEFAGGITDHGVMCGVPQFYAKMMAADKLPLIGEEFYCETQDGEKNRNHLILLAKNETGYKNLVKLSTESYGNFYRKPHVSYKMLEEHRDGLICTSACIGGEIPSDLRDDKAENAEKAARWFQKTFGEDFYIEIQRHGFDEEEKTNLALVSLARKLGIKLVAATDTHYLGKTDFEAHEVLLCISTGKTLADKNRLSFQGTGYHLYTADEMEELFSDIPEALDNTLEIAEKCKDIHIETGKYYLPEYKVPEGYANEFDYLYELAKNGFVKRYAPFFTVTDSDTEEQKQEKLKKKREYWDRFNYEMNTIKKMGFAGYFLIVWDFLNYAHENQIPTGPGRGCVNAGTLLYTENGLKPIEDVVVGENVYTHDGTLKPVLATFKYPLEEGEMLNHIRCYYGDAYGNAYTDDHKILAVKATRETDVKRLANGAKFAPMKSENPEWIAAKDLEPGDFVAFPKLDIPRNASKGFSRPHFATPNCMWSDYHEPYLLNDGCASTEYNCSDTQIVISDNYIFKRIYKIERIASDFVYDISVADNHSYVTSNFAAHKSGAGSMVLYCLQITDLDPMKYGLLFERFLNPDRISMPDIDSDLSESKRELVIDYVTQKYGSDHVAHIVTQGTLAAKSAIRDVAKVYGLSPSEAQRITKMIPDGPKVTIRKALEESPEFQAFAESSPMNQKIVQVAKTLEGTPRNLSTHACGICISREPMDEYLPELVVMDKQDGATVSTQYNMTECEDAGVLKMDFLGLRTLDVIDSTLKEIRAGHPDFTMKSNEIPVNDPMVYRFMAGGNTDGVFQFESDGMKRLLADMYQDIQETDTEEKGEEYFERLIAAVALYRPGPMDEIPKFIEAMRSGNIQYDHPKLKDILGNTYGVLVYQEQIMFAVRVLAGFTAGQSDKIRKAMGKKKLDIMEEYGEYFLHGSGEHDRLHPESPYGIKGCVANGIPEATAQLIWDKMVKFASYAFNKSHAACYALLAARTAWLSYYYPVECLSGILNSYLGNAEKLTQYIKTCTERKIRLLQPDVNKSLVGFHIEKDGDAQSIRFGLTGIKNVGAVAARAIVDERTIGGDFTSLENFIERMAKKGMDKTTLNALICTGALDCFPGTRSAKIVSFENMVKILTQVKKSNEDQMSFFDDTNEDHYLILPDVEEMSVKDIATLERDYLGLFVHHPVDAYKEKLDRWRARGMLSTIEGSAKTLKAGESKTVRLCGFVENKELKTFRKKDGTSGYVLKFTIDDGSGSVRCIAFNQDATNLVGTVQNNQVVYANGKLESNEFGISYKVTNVFVLG